MNCRALWSTLIVVIIGAWCQGAMAQPAEELRIRIENWVGGVICVSCTRAGGSLTIGRVTRPATAVNPQGYNASRWVNDGEVAATAVNAIHVKVRTDAGSGRGVIFSIVPADKTVGAATEKPSASIVTDVPAGEGIFGGLGPCVGSPVYQQSADETLVPLPPDYQPAPGDILVIVRYRSRPQVRYIDFENKFGGLITVTYRDGGSQVIGQVLKPVVGIGRFEGTVYAAPGRLRANHAGVIDVSTSPLGLVGGFQIVPREHANDAEVWYIRTKTQWMVVGPPDAREPSWEGVPPLFEGYLYPSYRSDDLTGRHKDWLGRVLSRCQVLAGSKGEAGWRLLPRIALDPEAPANIDRPKIGTWHIKASLNPYVPLPPAADTALEDVTNIRIVLPRGIFWPSELESSNQGE